MIKINQILIVLTIAVVSCNNNGQQGLNNNNADTNVKLNQYPTSPEEAEFIAASFPGGQDELNKYLEEKILDIKNPPKTIQHVEVTVGFIVRIDSSLSDFKIIDKTDDCVDCNTEALRIAKEMPKWIPAYMMGTKEYYETHAAIVMKFK